MVPPLASNNEESPLLNTHLNPIANQEETLKAESGKMNQRLALKIGAAMLSFSTLGLFNSSIGAILPLLSHHYKLTDLNVSVIFLVGPIGYILAAQFSDTIHYRFGQRGIAVIGPLLQVIAITTVALHPSFGLILVAFAIQGLGAGLLDGSWCAWAGSMAKANTISGLLHGSYSLGGAAGPFLVTILTTRRRPWWSWYSVLAGVSVLSLVTLASAFRHEDASAYRQSKQFRLMTARSDVKAIFKHHATWLCAAYFLTYVGTETAISGWIVSFMLRERHATVYLSGLSASGYWIGMAIGRLILGIATDKMGVRRATALYFLFAIGLEAVFTVVTSATTSVFLMTALGFVMGPLFPSGVVVLTRLLPGELHVAAVSFVASLGQVGGALLPFAIGSVVQGLGIGVFCYAILAQTTLSLLMWFAFARLRPTVLRAAGVSAED